ncbi:malonate transporter [[Actinobacillus] muris]|uniref:Malonate transporter n=1 Tax=Muribacter muris TaxID=67855 RepID=A0A0J5S4F4_9PAST|nr:AEC family transporter [Muribacter muris]KMK51687.1 malonate transporter [[Actinobacillus] muris] [Muribacter muris]
MFLDALWFSLGVTLPTILMLILGIVLYRRQMIDDHFCHTASKFVFNITLPCLLFINIVKQPTDYGSQLWLVSAGVVGTMAVYLGGEWLAARYIAKREHRGIFVQGIFRGNSGILGLALCVNAYGTAATAPASVYVACLTLLFNVLAIITLTHSLGDGKLNGGKMLASLAKNPLILAILCGLIVSKFEITIPVPLIRTGDYLAHITLPLALICTGASLDFSQLKQIKTQPSADTLNQIVIYSSLGRLFLTPIVMILLGKYLFQLEPMALGILFLMSSTPVAVASYAMVRSFGGNATAAANLIAITTVGAMFTSSLGLLILRQLHWI